MKRRLAVSGARRALRYSGTVNLQLAGWLRSKRLNLGALYPMLLRPPNTTPPGDSMSVCAKKLALGEVAVRSNRYCLLSADARKGANDAAHSAKCLAIISSARDLCLGTRPAGNGFDGGGCSTSPGRVQSGLHYRVPKGGQLRHCGSLDR